MRLLLALHGKSYVKDLINTPLNFLLPEDVQDSLATFIVPDVYVAFQQPAYPELLSLVAKVVTYSADEESGAEAIQELVNVSKCFLSIQNILKMRSQQILVIGHCVKLPTISIFEASGSGVVH